MKSVGTSSGAPKKRKGSPNETGSPLPPQPMAGPLISAADRLRCARNSLGPSEYYLRIWDNMPKATKIEMANKAHRCAGDHLMANIAMMVVDHTAQYLTPEDEESPAQKKKRAAEL